MNTKLFLGYTLKWLAFSYRILYFFWELLFMISCLGRFLLSALAFIAFFGLFDSRMRGGSIVLLIIAGVLGNIPAIMSRALLKGNELIILGYIQLMEEYPEDPQWRQKAERSYEIYMNSNYSMYHF